jgi:signal transduction histidine kinase
VVVNKHVVLLLIVAVYVMAFMMTFDELYDSVQIVSVALIGLCGWFYGIRIGIASIPAFILINTAILYLVSGKPYDILLTYNPIGIILSLVMTLATGSIRESQNRLNELRSTLISRINEATAELDAMTRQLIENDEIERIRIGQDLHDGIGQYLTGMLLHSEALSYKLRANKRTEVDLADRMTERIDHSMQIVRKLSRSQLPINFTEISLETALDEMTSYFGDISGTQFRLEYKGNSKNIPAMTSQHLHRITHEIIYNAIYKCKAKEIGIQLITREKGWKLNVEGSGNLYKQALLSDLVSVVMGYRNRAIGGHLTFSSLPKGGFLLEYSAVFNEAAQ